MIELVEQGQRCEVRVEGDMTIYDAAALKPVLLDAVARHAETEINLAGVNEMDSAGVQLLLLARREAHKRNASLRLVAHSEASLDVIGLLGLAGYFGDPLNVANEGRK